MKLFSFLFISIFVIAACAGTKNFSAEGIYFAPNSKFQIEINSKGKIKDGDDLSFYYDTNFKISPLDSAKSETTGEISGRENNEVIVIDKKVYPKGDLKKLLGENLKTNGFDALDLNELDETVSIIRGISGGPKSIFLKGQTKFLEVIKTNYEYK